MSEFKPDPAVLIAAADILKALAHPVRLCLVTGLARQGGRPVSEIQDCLGMPQAVVSQHLARLRAAGVVKGSRRGNQVYYEVTSALAAKVAGAIWSEKTSGE